MTASQNSARQVNIQIRMLPQGHKKIHFLLEILIFLRPGATIGSFPGKPYNKEFNLCRWGKTGGNVPQTGRGREEFSLHFQQFANNL